MSSKSVNDSTREMAENEDRPERDSSNEEDLKSSIDVYTSSSSSDDSWSSLGDWREISKRIDTDFESESEEQIPKAQSSRPPKVSACRRRPSISWRLLTLTPNVSSTPLHQLQSNLKRQKASAQDSRSHQFACSFANCNRSYTSKTGLRVHLAFHKGMEGASLKHFMIDSYFSDTKRIYLCVVCSQRFMRMKDLASHLNCSHKGNNWFTMLTLTTIAESFVDPNMDVKAPVPSSAGPSVVAKAPATSPKTGKAPAASTLPVRRYKCSIPACSKQYVRIRNLKEHCEKHHPGCQQLEDIAVETRLMLKCSQCNANFATETNRKRHWKQKHMKTKVVRSKPECEQ